MIIEANEKAALFDDHPHFEQIREKLLASLPEGSSVIDLGQVNIEQNLWCLQTETSLRSFV